MWGSKDSWNQLRKLRLWFSFCLTKGKLWDLERNEEWTRSCVFCVKSRVVFRLFLKKGLKYLQSINSTADMSNSRNSIFNCFAFLHLRILDLLIHTWNENLQLLFRASIFCCNGETNASEILAQLIRSSIQITFTRLYRNSSGKPEKGKFLD